MLDNITNHYTKDISCKLQTPTQKRSITKMSGIFLSQAVSCWIIVSIMYIHLRQRGSCTYAVTPWSAHRQVKKNEMKLKKCIVTFNSLIKSV